ncbi:mRNA-capping enzyme [Paramyrothecium foliicola]|nr:mRNA-capping enzyme [Paramyrothecium foliicola]
MAAISVAQSKPSAIITDPHESDPPLLREHSEFKSFTTSSFVYPEIRIFFRQHTKANELPTTPAPLPLLVCIPGLGGSVAQFHPLLSSLIDLAPCLAIDHPGCGRSKFAPTDWEAYTTEALVELYETIIEEYRDAAAGQNVVLIGHSMGTSISAWLANGQLPHKTSLAERVVGLIAICPVPGPLDENMTTWARRFFWVPGWLFDLWRAWDGRGGPNSASVTRFVGEEAGPELRTLQYRFNKQSRTPVWRRMAYGALPNYNNGHPVGGIPGLEAWATLDIPVFLIAGQNDHIVSVKDAEKIAKALKYEEFSSDSRSLERHDELVVDAAAPVSVSTRPRDHVPQAIDEITADDFRNKLSVPNDVTDDDIHNDPSTPLESPAGVPAQPRHPRKVVKLLTIPAPATHAVLYTPRCARVLAGHISDFLGNNITGRLFLGWQLQYLSREGKWDVKNLAKWKSVAPVSEPIGPKNAPIFRAMKTLREVDEVHSPKEFCKNWSHVIKDVIDISKDQPVYDPRGLERANVHYHKFPTVSKVPPDNEEVEAFIKLVDSLRAAQKHRAIKEQWEMPEQCLIGVHCHYGFNRTGYFIVCYLIERCGFSVKDAVETFAKARPNGIRHSHFLDRLYVRYDLNPAEE